MITIWEQKDNDSLQKKQMQGIDRHSAISVPHLIYGPSAG